MSDLTTNFTVSPFSYVRTFFYNTWKVIEYTTTISSMARAADQLRRMGYEKEALDIYDQMRKLKIAD
jgi:hypothetical protein